MGLGLGIGLNAIASKDTLRERGGERGREGEREGKGREGAERVFRGHKP